jgi:hypothetical protein
MPFKHHFLFPVDLLDFLESEGDTLTGRLVCAIELGRVRVRHVGAVYRFDGLFGVPAFVTCAGLSVRLGDRRLVWFMLPAVVTDLVFLFFEEVIDVVCLGGVSQVPYAGETSYRGRASTHLG